MEIASVNFVLQSKKQCFKTMCSIQSYAVFTSHCVMVSKLTLWLIIKFLFFISHSSRNAGNFQNSPAFSMTHDFRANYSKKNQLETNKEVKIHISQISVRNMEPMVLYPQFHDLGISLSNTSLNRKLIFPE